MKTIEQILKYESQTLDGRDIKRLGTFTTNEKLKSLGLTPSKVRKEYKYTRENVIKCLESDLADAFDHALNRSVFPADMMFRVIKMWMWVLDEHEDLVNWSDDDYAHYGLPYLKAVAIRYGLENPIGDDRGDEIHYSTDCGFDLM